MVSIILVTAAFLNILLVAVVMRQEKMFASHDRIDIFFPKFHALLSPDAHDEHLRGFVIGAVIEPGVTCIPEVFRLTLVLVAITHAL